MSHVQAVVNVRNLRRHFGDLRAVQGVNFSLYPGQVVGFIGANGAGKTTTMRMLATLDLPTAGSIEVCGLNAVEFPARVRQCIGWMPDAYGRYPLTTVAEYLDFYARAFGYRGDERRARLQEVMAFTDLTPLAQRDIDTLSKGMAQRLCLGRMLLHDPEVLIMDEPAAGLDPKARVEFKHFVRLLAADQKAIFISSHILSELEDMCDTILFIDKGKIVHHGATEGLKRQDGATVIVSINVADDPQALCEWIALHPGIALLERTKQGCRASLDSMPPEAVATLLRQMIQDGLQITEFHQQEQTLEDAFITMIEKLEGSAEASP